MQRETKRRKLGLSKLETAKSTESQERFTQVKNLDEFRITDMPVSDVFYMPSFIPEDSAKIWYSELLKLDSCESIPRSTDRRTLTPYRVPTKAEAIWTGNNSVPENSRNFVAYATDPNLTLKYSGQTVDMKYEYPPVLREIQDQVEEKLGVVFNHVMLNLYEDGNVYIGNHRDNLENKWAFSPGAKSPGTMLTFMALSRVIASVSLGAPRTFIITHDKRIKSTSVGGTPAPSTKTSDNSTRPSASARSKKRPYDETSNCASDSTVNVTQKRWILVPGSLVVMQGETQRHWKHEIPREPKVKEGRISLTFRQLVT